LVKISMGEGLTLKGTIDDGGAREGGRRLLHAGLGGVGGESHIGVKNWESSAMDRRSDVRMQSLGESETTAAVSSS
jgi:hypothetical protein